MSIMNNKYHNLKNKFQNFLNEKKYDDDPIFMWIYFLNLENTKAINELLKEENINLEIDKNTQNQLNIDAIIVKENLVNKIIKKMDTLPTFNANPFCCWYYEYKDIDDFEIKPKLFEKKIKEEVYEKLCDQHNFIVGSKTFSIKYEVLASAPSKNEINKWKLTLPYYFKEFEKNYYIKEEQDLINKINNLEKEKELYVKNIYQKVKKRYYEKEKQKINDNLETMRSKHEEMVKCYDFKNTRIISKIFSSFSSERKKIKELESIISKTEKNINHIINENLDNNLINNEVNDLLKNDNKYSYICFDIYNNTTDRININKFLEGLKNDLEKLPEFQKQQELEISI